MNDLDQILGLITLVLLSITGLLVLMTWLEATLVADHAGPDLDARTQPTVPAPVAVAAETD